MAHAVVAVECHHRCSSQMPSVVSVVTTSSSAATTSALAATTNIGTLTSSSISSAANGNAGDVQRRRRRLQQQQQMIGTLSRPASSMYSSYKLHHGHSSTSSSSTSSRPSGSATSSMIMEPTMTPNAIVTITSVPLTIPSVAVAPVPPLLGSKQLVVPNITIASIGQTTTSQLIPRTIESLPTKSDGGTNISTCATKFRRPASGTGLDFNRSFESTTTVPKSTFRLRSVVDSTVAANAIGRGTTADESNLMNSDGGSGAVGGGDGECDGEGELSNIIVVETNLDRQSSAESVSTDFDPVKDLEWLNGVTTLPGSNLKFRYNEFGVMELITDGDINPQDAVADRCRPSRPVDATECKEVVDAHSTSSARGSARKRRRSVALRDDQHSHQGSSTAIAVGSTDDHSSQVLLDSKINLPQSTDSSVSSPAACLQSNDAMDAAVDEILNESATSQAMDDESPSILPQPSAASAAARSEKRGRPLGSKNVNSNKKFKSIFSWTTYLEQTKSIAAPTKCFTEAFPCGKNGFRVGMKLEAVDPVHQSLFCVVSVAEVRGFRLRLHFDGFSDCYDFWVNADSADIFKAGWCEKTNHKLEPPKGFAKNDFNWANYLKLTKALSAPKHLFVNKSSNCVTPHGFRVGMKLEAVDKKTVFMDRRNSSTSLVCVATISDVMDSRILIHFDGWDTIYDYWSDSTSPYIHPVGWCQEKGHVLMPPNKCKDPEHFTWEAYLTKSKSQAAPARAFKQRSPIGFKKGMRLEAIDPRNPSLIRVATVAEVGNHQVKLHFDGWAETYDFWLDDESPDIHPVTWCEKTGHPLEPPPSKDYCVMVSGQGSGCPTLGCKGVGHIRGPKYTTHHSSFGCPYSHSNLSKDMGIPDRVKTTKEPRGTEARNKSSADHPPKCSTSAAAAVCDEEELSVANPKLSSSSPMESTSPAEVVVSGGEESVVGATQSAVESSSSSCGRRGRGRRKRKELIAENHDHHHPQLPGDLRFGSDASSDSNSSLKCDSRSSVNSSMTSTSGPASIASELSSIVHRSIFMPGGNDSNRNGMCGISADHTLASFRRHAKLLPGLARLRGVDVGRWTVDQVTDFVRTLPGCQEVAKAFKDEQIDGEAFVLLNQADIVNLMNIKLGPALKIYNSIVMLHHMTAES